MRTGMMMDRKAYFLMLDSIFAIIILVIGFIMISSYNNEAAVSIQTEETARDVINLLAATRVREVCDDVIPSPPNDCACDALGAGANTLTSLCNAHKVRNPDDSLLELIGDLMSADQAADAQALTGYIFSSGLIYKPALYNVQMNIFAKNSWTLLYETPSATPQARSKNLISAKKIVFGYNKDDTLATYSSWGPYIIEVRVWQK